MAVENRFIGMAGIRCKEALKRRCGWGILLLLALGGCEQEPQGRPYRSPALDVVVTDTESTFCVHRDGKVEYILFYPGPFSNWSANGSDIPIEEPHAWLENGHLELFPTQHYIGVLREGTRPTELFLNGYQFGLEDSRGRVFVIKDSQTFEQIRVDTGVIKNEEDLGSFTEQLRAKLGQVESRRVFYHDNSGPKTIVNRVGGPNSGAMIIQRIPKKAQFPLLDLKLNPNRFFPEAEEGEFSTDEVLLRGGGGSGRGDRNSAFRKKVTLHSINYKEYMDRFSQSLREELKELDYNPDDAGAMLKHGDFYFFSMSIESVKTIGTVFVTTTAPGEDEFEVIVYVVEFKRSKVTGKVGHNEEVEDE